MRAVIVLGEAPPPVWGWSWWTQLIIPVLGVLASTFVGVVAIVVARHLAHHDQEVRAEEAQRESKRREKRRRRERDERDAAARRRVYDDVSGPLMRVRILTPAHWLDASRAPEELHKALKSSLAQNGIEYMDLENWVWLGGRDATQQFERGNESALRRWIDYGWTVAETLQRWSFYGPRDLELPRWPDDATPALVEPIAG